MTSIKYRSKSNSKKIFLKTANALIEISAVHKKISTNVGDGEVCQFFFLLKGKQN